jgi:hypothetical protein
MKQLVDFGFSSFFAHPFIAIHGAADSFGPDPGSKWECICSSVGIRDGQRELVLPQM